MTPEQGAERLLDGLDGAQRAAVTCPAKTVRVSAGPGSGKTRVLTHRIAWQIATGNQDPRHVLALTFTRAAAREMRGRLAQLGVRDVTASTLHAACLALWTQRLRDTGRYLPALVKDRRRLLAAVLDGGGNDSVGEPGWADGNELSVELLDREVTWANSRALTPAAYASAASAARRDLPVAPSVVADALARYELIKRKRGVVDFDDLLLLVLHELRTDRQWAAAQRWRYQHLYVDEYQDLTVTQRALLAELAGRDSEGNPSGELFVVGDPNQAIFGFSGAEADGFDNFAVEFPDAALMTLSANHRSAPAVVTAAKTVLDSGMEATRSDLVGRVTVTAFPSEGDEARSVARQLRDSGRPFSRRAVLARTNAALDAVEAACLQAGIPVERQQDLLRRPEVRHALAEVRRLGLGRAASSLRHDLLDISADILAGFEGAVPDDDEGDRTGWLNVEAGAGVREAPAESYEYVLARHHLDELSDLVSEFVTFAPAAPVESFLFWLNVTANGTATARQVRGAVSLRTIHRAKGLEWSDVWVVGCEEDLLPLRGADPDEERRLAYVALSRAVKNLHCSWAERRSTFGRARNRTPSRFLAQLVSAETVAATQEAFTNGERVTAIRAELAAVAEPRRHRPPRKADRSALVRAVERRVRFGEDVRSALLEVLAAEWKTSVDAVEARAAENPTFARELTAVMLTLSSLASLRRSA